MAEQAPPRRPDIAVSKLRAPTRTCYYNSFFLFKTEVALDGRPAEIGCSQDGELSLSCRREQDGESKKTSVSFPSISAKVEGILKKYGVFEVVTFFCEDSPLFQVTFSSEDELKLFLRRRERVEKELADLFSHMLQPVKGQAQVPATPIPAQVSSTLFLMTPDWYDSQCGSIEVSLENYSDCVSVWRDSKVFEYGTVLSQKKNPKISIVKQSLTTSTSDLRHGQDTATSTSDLRQGQDKMTSTSDLTELITENGNSRDPIPEVQSVSDSRHEQDGDDEISVVSVLRWLEEVSEWFVLGTHLNLPQHELKMIQQDHPSNSRECRLAMVDTWIRLGGASWSGLVRALWEIGRRGLAKKMATKFGLPLPADTSDQKEPSVQCELLTDISLKDQRLEDTTATVVLAEEKRNKALEEIAEHTRQLNQHVARLPQLGLEKEQLSTQLRETREGHQKLEELLGKQTHALLTLKQEATRLHSQLEQKDREIAAITAEAEELKAKLQETTDKLTTASSEVNKLKTEREVLKFELESKRRELEKDQSKSEATVKEMKNEREALSSDLESKRQELEKEQYRSLFKDDTIRDLKGELVALRAEATSKAEQTGELKGRLSAKTEEVVNLKKALHKAEQGKPVLPEQPSPAAILQQQLLQAMETTDLRVKLATAEEGRQEVKRQLGALQRQVQLLQDEIKGKQQKILPTSFEWRRCRDTPVIVEGATTVVMNGRAYTGCTSVYGPHVLEYTPESDEWVKLPKPPVEDFGFAVLNNQLVLVGGMEPSTRRRTNNIAVFEPSTRQWVQAYPPMPTARSFPSAIVYQHYLIVAGGRDDDRKSLSTVEVLDSVNKKWYSAEQVPIKCDHMIPVVISDTAYLLGGWSDGKRTKTVLAVSLPVLINKATSQPQEVNTPTSWKMLPDSPLYHSAPFTSHGMLLTAGGTDESGEYSSHIYCYDPVTNQWEKVGDLPTHRFMCGCAVLPSTELLVVGGGPGPNLKSVYKATIQWK